MPYSDLKSADNLDEQQQPVVDIRNQKDAGKSSLPDKKGPKVLEAEKDKSINNKPPNPPMNKKKSLPEELSDLKRVALETPKVQRIDGLSKRDDISNSQSELL